MKFYKIFLCCFLYFAVACQPLASPLNNHSTIVVITPVMSDQNVDNEINQTDIQDTPIPLNTTPEILTASSNTPLPQNNNSSENQVEFTPTVCDRNKNSNLIPKDALKPPTLEPTPEIWPTVTRQILNEAEKLNLVSCQFRNVPDDLLTIVTQQFYLPESYSPNNLVLLSDYFDSNVTLNKEIYVSNHVIEPLVQMINEMHRIGLNPSILSGYRSYEEQALAWHWWNSQYPDRAAILSAQPGKSEHQLGTTIDFGSPAMNHLFHVDFGKTPEGKWLEANAHRYGFTLSYPKDTYDITGFKFEPWHFRFIGVDWATFLFENNLILTEWQIRNYPAPCIP